MIGKPKSKERPSCPCNTAPLFSAATGGGGGAASQDPRRPIPERLLNDYRCARKHCNRSNLTVSLIILTVRWCSCFILREQFLGGVLFIRGRPTLRSRKDNQTDDTRHSHCKRRKMPNQSSCRLFNTADA
jgi:hypothetical protein